MRKRITLIHPPIQDFFQTTYRQEPLGLRYLAAVLESHNYNVQFIDAFASQSRQTIAIPGQLAYLQQFYISNDLSPFKLFQHFQHFGMSYDEIVNQVVSFQPAAIGISINFSAYVDSALTISRMIKQIIPEVPIIAGGHHATAAPESLLETGGVNFVVLGEGEQVLPHLLQEIGTLAIDATPSTPGIAYFTHGRIHHNPPAPFIDELDSLPIPALIHKRSPKMIITSRGCPRQCEFCSIHRVMGRQVRFHSIERVMQEIQMAVDAGIRHIDFEDDTLTIHRERSIELFSTLINRFADQGITFSALNGIDPRTLDAELIQLMKQAGFKWLNLPLVSRHAATQTRLQRQMSTTHFQEIIEIATNHHLKVVAYLIIGLPDDSINDMLSDILFLAGQQALLGPSIFYPPPGTAIFDNCVKRGFIQKDNFITFRSSAVPVETDQFSRSDIITIFRITRLINYMKHLIDTKLSCDTNFLNFLMSQHIHDVDSEFNHKLSKDDIGMRLLADVFEYNTIHGCAMRKLPGGNYRYRKVDYKCNQQLVNQFIAQLHNLHVTGISTAYKFTF